MTAAIPLWAIVFDYLLGTIMWITRWFEHGGRLSGKEVAGQVAELALASVLREAPAVAGEPR